MSDEEINVETVFGGSKLFDFNKMLEIEPEDGSIMLFLKKDMNKALKREIEKAHQQGAEEERKRIFEVMMQYSDMRAKQFHSRPDSDKYVFGKSIGVAECIAFIKRELKSSKKEAKE